MELIVKDNIINKSCNNCLSGNKCYAKNKIIRLFSKCNFIHDKDNLLHDLASFCDLWEYNE